MDVIKYPAKKDWTKLTGRPVISQTDLFELVSKILLNVKQNGDQALKQYSLEFDQFQVSSLRVDSERIKQAASELDKELIAAIDIAHQNIEKFHRSQIEESQVIETMPGVSCWRKSVPIDRVGLYVPGGSAPLFSTLLMLGIPAIIAGCSKIVVCTPANKNGQIDATIRYTAERLGISEIYTVGGAQAIAAMAYGTESIPRVQKIFGPGNQYVTAAKQMISLEGVAIDLPAGPSEVAVIADDQAHPDFVAADLLSQAEHGPDSQVLLATPSASLLEKVLVEVDLQLDRLPRREIARRSLDSAKIVLLKSLDECIDLINLYAPEHLILATENARNLSERITSAGSVFIGHYSSESAGDYASGTNHTLPTNGYAHSYSGVSLDSFFKKITFQEISPEGIKGLGPAIEKMAHAESLSGHAEAVRIRRQYLQTEGQNE